MFQQHKLVVLTLLLKTKPHTSEIFSVICKIPIIFKTWIKKHTSLNLQVKYGSENKLPRADTQLKKCNSQELFEHLHLPSGASKSNLRAAVERRKRRRKSLKLKSFAMHQQKTHKARILTMPKVIKLLLNIQNEPSSRITILSIPSEFFN